MHAERIAYFSEDKLELAQMAEYLGCAGQVIWLADIDGDAAMHGNYPSYNYGLRAELEKVLAEIYNDKSYAKPVSDLKPFYQKWLKGEGESTDEYLARTAREIYK